MEKKNNNNNQIDTHQGLYICMQNYTQKKKDLLLNIQNVLFMQEEHQKLLEIRKNKSIILQEIKKSIDEINKMYINLRKILPNVKNFLSYTQKEINELDRQISALKVDTKSTQANVRIDENIKDKLQTTNKNIRTILKDKQKLKEQQKLKKEEENKHLIPNINRGKMSKLDRIQNNLKVIEAKLKGL